MYQFKVCVETILFHLLDLTETSQDLHKRKNLYSQFRLWKRMKRKKYYLIVTQSAKKEMAEAEKAEQQRLDQRTKLEHAKAYRRELATRFRDIFDPVRAFSECYDNFAKLR